MRFKQSNGALIDRELVLGYAILQPGLKAESSEQTILIDKIEFQAGPGNGVYGEFLWDATMVSRMLLSARLSTVENP